MRVIYKFIDKHLILKMTQYILFMLLYHKKKIKIRKTNITTQV